MVMKLSGTIGCCIVALGLFGAFKSWAQANPDRKMVPEIRSYTYWVAVNKTPVAMNPRVAAMCALMPTSSLKPVKGTQGPHDKKWINVFVNFVGANAMLTQKQPHFPVGTVIVKQKLPFIANENSKGEVAGTAPELLTVMVKQKVGYDSDNGDWEYMVTDGAGETVTQRGKIASCQGCHQNYKRTDYAVRSYLPESVRKALKDMDNTTATSDDKKASH